MEPHIGCSSYATPSWKSLFYPENLRRKDWFDFYASHFNTYEFNSSFYRFPTVAGLRSWHDRVDADFTFSIKVPKIITHIKRLKDCDEQIKEFYEISKEGFRDKLAAVLWQLPPSFTFSESKLISLIRGVQPDFKNVAEFRHASWWNKDVITQLAENNITFCNVNYPGLPTSILKTTPMGYVRMHGNPELFYSEYTGSEIISLYRELSRVDFSELFVYFNNTASTAGITNALQLQKIHKSV